MDKEDIKEIVNILLTDLEITPEEEHYEIALNYYQKYNEFPDVSFIVEMALRNQNEKENDNHSRDNNNKKYEEEAENEQDRYSDADNESSEEDLDEINMEYPDEDTQIQILTNNPDIFNVKKVVKDIEKVPLIMFKITPNDCKNTECIICYDKFVETDICRLLPCKHLSHKYCIDHHLTKVSHLCPYCNYPVGEYIYLNI